MAYNKQNFIDGQVLKAEHLNNMEAELAREKTWDELADRPFGTFVYECDIVPEQTVTLADNDGMMGAYLAECSFPTADETYTVIYNGSSYSCICQGEGTTGAFIGNVYKLYGAGDTGEPFVLYFSADRCALIDLDGATSATIRASGRVVDIKKISEDYLPSIAVSVSVDGTAARTNFAATETDEYKLGNCAFAEGNNTKASGSDSHAEGYGTTASGVRSHAEGTGTTASNHSSHAEGYGAIASGEHSHAEGRATKAEGDNSHAEGFYTIASRNYSHVQGSYNIEDTEKKYIHIVGNGTSDKNRSNAHTLDRYGNAWFAGIIEGNGLGLPSPDGTKYLFGVMDGGRIIMVSSSNAAIVSVSNMMVSATLTNGAIVAADKTYAEILEHVSAAGDATLIVTVDDPDDPDNGDKAVYRLAGVTTDVVCFSQAAGQAIIMFMADGTITMQS